MTPAAVPTEIRPLVRAVAGLDTTSRMYSTLVRPPAGTPHPIRPNSHFNGKPLFAPDGGYGPWIFVNSYDLPAANGVTGTGRASGVAMDGDFLDSDLAAFLAYFGITRTGPPTVRVAVDGGAPPGLSHDSGETTLDVETIVSLAPGTALYVYLAPYSISNENFIDIDNTVVNDNLVDTLNGSYTYCENRLNHRVPGYSESVDAIMEQGAAQGITFHSATGDWGPVIPFGCPHKISIGTPTDVPHNVSIGGTTLQVDPNTGQETSEVGWNSIDGATGGGVSVIFPVPAYQQGVPNVIARGRNVPDLSFDAGSQSGAAFYYNGSFGGPVNGTSLASPIFGAALTEIDQLQNSRAGYFNVTLYQTWLANGYGNPAAPYLRDMTIGNIPPYGAGPGYDQMTGIGVMRATTFAALLPH
jgi:kumamolisin